MKTKKQLLEAKAIKLWAEIVMRKGNYKCLVCGKRATDPHHFIFRSRSLVLKYDVENGIPLCGHCHTLIHRRQDSAVQGMIALKKGEDWLNYIKSRKVLSTTKTIKWLKEQIRILEEYSI